MQDQLRKTERELRRTAIAEQRQAARSRWSRRQPSQPESIGARMRRSAAVRDERRESLRRQQAIRDAARKLRALRWSLGDQAPSSRKPRRWSL
jgi:hypothetical protein